MGMGVGVGMGVLPSVIVLTTTHSPFTRSTTATHNRPLPVPRPVWREPRITAVLRVTTVTWGASVHPTPNSYRAKVSARAFWCRELSS